jgi:hypothetical protein
MNMHLTKLTWVGIACIAAAIAAYGAWCLWFATRIERPVYMPVSLVVGHVHVPEFRINLSGSYEITVEAQKRIPFDTLNCLLGMSMAPEKCNVNPVVKASCAVTSNGVVIAEGNSDTERGGAWGNDTIEKQICSFEGKKNRRYAVDLDFTADGSALRPTDPHLVVGITSDFIEGAMWISFFLSLGCSAVATFGLVLLGISGVRLMYRRRRKSQPIAS